MNMNKQRYRSLNSSFISLLMSLILFSTIQASMATMCISIFSGEQLYEDKSQYPTSQSIYFVYKHSACGCVMHHINLMMDRETVSETPLDTNPIFTELITNKTSLHISVFISYKCRLFNVSNYLY